MFSIRSGLTRWGVIAALSLGALVVPATPAKSYPCYEGFYRTYDYTNHVSSIGINSQLKVPTSTEVWGFGSQVPTAGDIALIDYSTGGFVQYGWYVGSAGALPYTSTPRVFFGESTSPSTETLVAGPALAWGSFHNFRILQTSAGGYHMYLDGAYMLSNSYPHGTLPTPQVTAETDFLCTRMWTLAERNPNPPVSTLYYATGSPSAPTWNLFTDSYLKSADATNSDNFVSESAGGRASFYGYGGG